MRVVARDIGLPVGILNPHQFSRPGLRQYAMLIKCIRQGEIASSQFPETLTDHKSTFTKPAGW